MSQIAFFQHLGDKGENVPLSKMLKGIKGRPELFFFIMEGRP